MPPGSREAYDEVVRENELAAIEKHIDHAISEMEIAKDKLWKMNRK